MDVSCDCEFDQERLGLGCRSLYEPDAPPQPLSLKSPFFNPVTMAFFELAPGLRGNRRQNAAAAFGRKERRIKGT
jgi:hypothetical protein